MGLVLKSNNINIKIHQNKIIGVMGINYDRFLVSIGGNNISYIGKIDNFYTNNVISEINIYTNNVISEINIYNNDIDSINYYLDKLMLNKEFLDKKISDLSYGEKHLLRYLIGFIRNKKIIVIDEPFLDLDYDMKKRIIFLLKEMLNNHKTIIIGSFDSDVIYSISSYVLLLSHNKHFYGGINNVFSNNDILSLYDIKKPQIVSFVDIIRNNKKIMIDYSNDIRDLIKDVYRNV